MRTIFDAPPVDVWRVVTTCRDNGPYVLFVNGFEIGHSNDGMFDIRTLVDNCRHEIKDWFCKEDGELDHRKFSVLIVSSNANENVSIRVNNNLLMQGGAY